MAFLRLAQVLQETGLSKSTVYELVKKGEFPSSIRLADKAVGWVDTEVQGMAGRAQKGKQEPRPVRPSRLPVDRGRLIC